MKYIYNLRRFFRYLEENISIIDAAYLSKISESDILNYFKTSPYTPSTIKGYLVSISSLYHYLLQHQLIPSDPTVFIKLPKIRRKKIIFLNRRAINQLYFAFENSTGKFAKRNRLIYMILFTTGMRISELTGINLNDLFLEYHYVKVTRKGGNEAYIYLSDECIALLKEYLLQRNSVDTMSKALFLSSRRKRLSVRQIQKIFKQKSEITKTYATPHIMRHSFAIATYHNTNDIYLVSKALGHKDVNITKEHYVFFSDERLKNIRNHLTFSE